MVVAAFPVAKLGALILRQISKPIATFAKERAKQNQFFRTYICMPPAQFYNWCEVKMKMWILNLGKPVTVPSLNETMAIELGANLLGEGIIFIIASGLLFMEYSRQVRKDTAKEAARQEEISSLNYTIQELYFQAERQDAQIRELLHAVADLESRVIQKPWKYSSLTKENQEKQPDESKTQLSEGQNSNYNKYDPRISYTVLNNEWPKRNGLVLSSLAYLTNDVIRNPTKSI